METRGNDIDGKQDSLGVNNNPANNGGKISETTSEEVNVHSDGNFILESPVWYPSKVWPKGSFISEIGSMNIVGPFGRIALTKRRPDVDYMTCLFCFKKNLIGLTPEANSIDNSPRVLEESSSPRCTNCNRLLLKQCFWMIDFEQQAICLGDPVALVLKNTVKKFFGIITSVNLKQENAQIAVHGYVQEDSGINVKKITLARGDLRKKSINLKKIDVLSPEIAPLLTKGLCGACGGIYDLGNGHLLSQDAKKIENAQYSYHRLSEKIAVAVSQRNIFMSKKQKKNILSTQENINHMLIKRKELEIQLAAVCVGCAKCGWTPFKSADSHIRENIAGLELTNTS